MTTGLSQGDFNIDRMCWLAGVSRASYYRHWLDSAPRRAETGLRDLIQKMALGNAHYGYRGIGALLRREGWQVNHKCVLRIMREDNLLCLRTRPFVPATTNSRHGWQVVPNLARGMILSGVNQLWVADITFLHLAEEFAFLAVVLDAFSRRVIGGRWIRISERVLPLRPSRWPLPIASPLPGGLVHHSDRGVQYACGAYSELLHLHGIQASMSRVGNPYDNAKAESFMKTLKQEEVQGLAYKDADDARRRIGAFIDTVYNTQRLHSALDYLTPEEYEQKHSGGRRMEKAA
ncbi:IS3 family transposase [Mesorhizobium humile]|uniref:IS3 family transposase n=1 Tax=Mesorhizobium humile TaxID=3072313 RepID=A0ABU4YJC8_9HYPH|nr:MULTISPECIES: IS3 family transposase [unclassified Mesorhizobium]MDX8457271.1 IS3 family transposase [Mesorhizobium sp. VK2D]MDX8487064.1 IS3 family transposase [Mesorhizobium sp. VK2B]